MQHRKRRRRTLAVAAVTWSLYGIYESAVWVWSQGVTAPIRVDLLLLGPVLYAVTILGVLAARRPGAESGASR